MLKYFRFGILISIALTCTGISAQQVESTDEPVKYYDVELIVFKNINVPKGQEFKLPTPSASRSENTLDLADPKSLQQAKDSGFTPLSITELKLQDSVDRIVKSSRYQLLTHTGWRQPGLNEENSIPVWIKGGKVFDSRYSSIDQAFAPETGDGKKNVANQQLQTAFKGLYELEGLVTITLSRYLHTKAELVLRKPADSASVLQEVEEFADSKQQDILDLDGQLLLNYGMNEQRRMRSRKLHYLDHPEFGMLVLITPYEPPAPESTPSVETLDTGTVTVANPDN